MNTCQHKNRMGDNYGETCLDCGERVKGYGYGGWFGQYLVPVECIHLFMPAGDDGAKFEICLYCEITREKVSK